jgi:ABC-2 type transport system ATP-binding protein
MLLRIEQLTKDYGSFRALDQLDLAVAPGEIYGLLGPNGSGKTTALRLLLGFLQPTSGRALIAGHDCWHASVAARQHVAYLPGELRLYENMTGRQLIRFLEGLRGQPANGAVERLARSFDIDIDRPIAQLSSGMKRKVALLQVLVTRAPLLILDEPTNTLDPSMRDVLLRHLRQAREQGQAVLFSSHVLAEVEQVCDRVGILQRGRLVHEESLRAGQQVLRRIRAAFRPGTVAVPELPGVRDAQQQDGRLELEYEGPLPPLLEWLAQRNVLELRIEEVGLGAVYRRYHGKDA